MAWRSVSLLLLIVADAVGLGLVGEHSDGPHHVGGHAPPTLASGTSIAGGIDRGAEADNGGCERPRQACAGRLDAVSADDPRRHDRRPAVHAELSDAGVAGAQGPVP